MHDKNEEKEKQKKQKKPDTVDGITYDPHKKTLTGPDGKVHGEFFKMFILIWGDKILISPYFLKN